MVRTAATRTASTLMLAVGMRAPGSGRLVRAIAGRYEGRRVRPAAQAAFGARVLDVHGDVPEVLLEHLQRHLHPPERRAHLYPLHGALHLPEHLARDRDA